MTTKKPNKVTVRMDQDWTEVLKGATPEAVAKALLQPRKPLKPRPK